MSILPAESSGVGAVLRGAARMYDASPTLQTAARRLAFGGFRGGCEWMALALGELRGTRPTVPAGGAASAGLMKYGAAALAAGIVVAGAAGGWLPWAAGVPLAGLAFYAVEAQGAFVMCAIADGSATPWRDSRRLIRLAGGALVVTVRIIMIAAFMVCGGFGGRGFLRAWCVGCLAVVLWYERLRR